MLLPLLVVSALYIFGAIAVGWVVVATVKRLALDPWAVLLWFGLAEAPPDELAVRRAAPAGPRPFVVRGSYRVDA